MAVAAGHDPVAEAHGAGRSTLGLLAGNRTRDGLSATSKARDPVEPFARRRAADDRGAGGT